jgi:hypothetical protein
VLALFVGIGITTSFKRVYVGFMQGKRVFATYSEDVASLMRKVLLIGQVGVRKFHCARSLFDRGSKNLTFQFFLFFAVARDIEMRAMVARDEDEDRPKEDNIWKNVEQICDEDASRAAGLDDPLLEPVERDGITRNFTQSHQAQIIELLGDWEDPEAVPEHGMASVEVSLLQFCTPVRHMKNVATFSPFRCIS